MGKTGGRRGWGYLVAVLVEEAVELEAHAVETVVEGGSLLWWGGREVR